MQHVLDGRRVLVVEDDYFIATDMAAMLTRAGAMVIGPAGNVDDALAALDEAPDIAVLDLRLGDELSLPVADELGRRGIPYIFVSGTISDLPDRHGAFAVCVKPTNDARVRAALADALEAACPQ